MNITDYCEKHQVSVVNYSKYDNGNCEDFACFNISKKNAIQLDKHTFETIDYYIVFLNDWVLLHRKKMNDIFLMDINEYKQNDHRM